MPLEVDESAIARVLARAATLDAAAIVAYRVRRALREP
jgi:hypothetical protein